MQSLLQFLALISPLIVVPICIYGALGARWPLMLGVLGLLICPLPFLPAALPPIESVGDGLARAFAIAVAVIYGSLIVARVTYRRWVAIGDWNPHLTRLLAIVIVLALPLGFAILDFMFLDPLRN